MKKIQLLDCTLRDGGSINNGMFGNSNILKICQFLNDANIEIIETGFFDNNVISNKDSTINSNINFFNEITSKIKNKKCKTFAMIDFSKFNIKNFNKEKRTYLDGIRIMFKKERLSEVINFSYILKDLNYELILNPVSITTYSTKELENLLKEVNKINPNAVYIVDTYGLLDKDETLDYFRQFNDSLNIDIKIGYHSHNNRQLSLSNSIELINNTQDRNLIIDTALYGMGKRAGNTPTELMANHLNTHHNFNYDLNKLTQIINENILPLKNKYEWGYSIIHYIAAINKCHSDYVTYLYKERNFTIKKINNILKRIEEYKKLTFDYKYITELADN